MQATLKLLRSFIGHNFGDYKNDCYDGNLTEHVLSVTILETTKTSPSSLDWIHLFYRSQFWRLQKLGIDTEWLVVGFIGHNFGDYKNLQVVWIWYQVVLSVTILETTKTLRSGGASSAGFYRSQFWRLQKPTIRLTSLPCGFIGHNFGDYKNHERGDVNILNVLSVTILETTKTSNGIS